MKKAVTVLFLLALLAGPIYAGSIKEVKRMDPGSIGKLLGDKILTLNIASLAHQSGDVFLLLRDRKTRKLEWALIDPFSGKLKGRGSCPFQVFNLFSVSPDGCYALVSSRMPGILWRLDVAAGKWEKVYSNPPEGKEGLSLLSVSSISFSGNESSFTMMDLWDKAHLVVDCFVASLKLNPFAIEKVASLKTLDDTSLKTLFKKLPKDYKFELGLFRFAPDSNFIYTMKSRSKEKNQDGEYSYREYLFKFIPPKHIKLLTRRDGVIMPLDYVPYPMTALYTVTSSQGKEKKVGLMLQNEKKTIPLMTGNVIAGKILGNGNIGAVAVQDKKFGIYLGKSDGKMEKALSLNSPYAVGFLSDGKRLVLINKGEIRTFKLSMEK